MLALLVVGCARAPARTWRSFAGPFSERYCTRCHQPGAEGAVLDLRTYADVVEWGPTIRCGLAPTRHPTAKCAPQPHAGEFPLGKGPFPSDEERLAFVAWLDAGAPY